MLESEKMVLHHYIWRSIKVNCNVVNSVVEFFTLILIRFHLKFRFFLFRFEFKSLMIQNLKKIIDFSRIAGTLINRNADVNSVSDLGDSILHTASERGDLLFRLFLI